MQSPREIQLLDRNKTPPQQYGWAWPTGDAKLRLKYCYFNKEQSDIIKSCRIFGFLGGSALLEDPKPPGFLAADPQARRAQ